MRKTISHVIFIGFLEEKVKVSLASINNSFCFPQINFQSRLLFLSYNNGFNPTLSTQSLHFHLRFKHFAVSWHNRTRKDIKVIRIKLHFVSFCLFISLSMALSSHRPPCLSTKTKKYHNTNPFKFHLNKFLVRKRKVSPWFFLFRSEVFSSVLMLFFMFCKFNEIFLIDLGRKVS